MRGVRIQSIVRELNDEKIDVIEWDSDQKTFIAKALSPARVSQVFLEDHPDEGKTASVIVPDDQLSLAIGREGQNARLAAKLTGWRIDIKSLTEAAEESMGNLDHPAADPAIVTNKELISQAELILAKKEANRPITSEDYMLLNRIVAGIEGRMVAQRAVEFEQIQKERAAARKLVPDHAWEISVESLGLPAKLQKQLEKEDIKSAGDILFKLEIGEETLLRIKDFDKSTIEKLKEAVDAAMTEAIEAGVPAAEVEAVAAEAVTEPGVEEAAEDQAVEEETAEAEAVVEVEEPVTAAEVEAAEAVEEAVAEAAEAEEEEEIDVLAAIDDLATPLIQVDEPKKKEKKKVVVVQPTPPSKDEEEDEEEAEKRRNKSKQLVFDEERGRVVTKRKRKGSRRRPEWEDLDVEDVLEDEF
jgi:N utilization substance protein A